MATMTQAFRVGAMRASIVLGLTLIPFAASANGVFPGPFEKPAPGTYSFSGNCLDCPPAPSPSPASAVLIMGTTLQTSSLSYQSSLYTLQSSAFEYIWGDLTQSGANNFKTLFIDDTNGQWWVFETSASGDWNLAKDDFGTNDYGNQGVWSTRPVPEPGTYALFGLGLGVLALVRRRQTAAAA